MIPLKRSDDGSNTAVHDDAKDVSKMEEGKPEAETLAAIALRVIPNIFRESPRPSIQASKPLEQKSTRQPPREAQRVSEVVKKHQPPKKAVRAPVQFYWTSDNKLRRVYRNRCERYCIGPLGIFVDSIGVFVLACVNLILLVFAVFCLGLGTTILRKSDPYGAIITAIRAPYDISLRKLGVSEQERADSLDIEGFLQIAAVPFFTVGFIMASVSFVGLIGSCFSFQTLLHVYTRLSALLLLIEFCSFLFIYDGEPQVFKRRIFESLKSYTGYKGTDTITGAWNLVMEFLQCCGVDSYLDFHSATEWVQEEIYLHNELQEYATPVFCCKNKTRDFSCAVKGIASPENNNMNTGCYNTAYNSVFRYPYVPQAFYCLMMCQVVVLFFSNWMYMSRELQALKPPPTPKPTVQCLTTIESTQGTQDTTE